MIEAKDTTANKGLRRGFVKARQRHLFNLYRHYARTSSYPFFVDISGPPPRMSFAQFVEYCTEDGATLSVFMNGDKIGGFVLISDIQLPMELANLDFYFFGASPALDSPEAHMLKTTLARILNIHALTRLQMLVLEMENSKIELLKWMGFEVEGLLREHFFFRGAHHNLVVLSRTEALRHEV